MKENNSPILNSIEELFNGFVNSDGYVEISENFNPNFIQMLVLFIVLPFKFCLVIENPVCDKCKSKMHKHAIKDYKLNNTILMKKRTYICSDPKCGCVKTPLWSKYIDKGCNYTREMKEFVIDVFLICNTSYQKVTELANLTKNVFSKRNTVFKFKIECIDRIIKNEEKLIMDEIEKQGIEFSDVLSYDEQYVKTNDGWQYKLTALDAVTGFVYDIQVVPKKEFNSECIKKFLKPLIKKYNISTVVTDGDNKYPSILEELEVNHALCIFHKIKNLMDLINPTLRKLIRDRDNLITKIEENTIRINEITQLRKGKRGRPKKTDTEAIELITEKKDLKKENTKHRQTILEYNKEIKMYEKCINDVQLVLKSKSKQAGYNRYERLLNNLENMPKKTHNFIINMEKQLDKLLMHTTNKNIPTTNNIIERYHGITLNGVNKRKYKTTRGVYEETKLKTIRWNKRIVLGLA